MHVHRKPFSCFQTYFIGEKSCLAVFLNNLVIYYLSGIFKEYFFVGQYPAPAVCLRRMYDRKVAGIKELEMTSQVEKFCKEITTVLEHKMSELFTKFCEIVYYDGMLCIFILVVLFLLIFC